MADGVKQNLQGSTSRMEAYLKAVFVRGWPRTVCEVCGCPGQGAVRRKDPTGNPVGEGRQTPRAGELLLVASCVSDVRLCPSVSTLPWVFSGHLLNEGAVARLAMAPFQSLASTLRGRRLGLPTAPGHARLWVASTMALDFAVLEDSRSRLKGLAVWCQVGLPFGS